MSMWRIITVSIGQTAIVLGIGLTIVLIGMMLIGTAQC